MFHLAKSLRWRSLGVTALLLCGPLMLPAEGALTHYVPFGDGYTIGNSLNGAGGSDLGFGSNTWFDGAAPGTGTEVLAGSLPGIGGLPTSGNSARTALSDFNLAFYTFDQNNDGNNGVVGEDNLGVGEHWVSLVARASEDAFFGGFSFVKFFGPEILYIGKTGGAGGTEWGLDQGAAGTVSVAGSDATVDTLLVLKLTIGPGANDDTVDLYLNPAPGAAPPAVADIAGYAINEDVNDNRAIDEIRLGSQNGAFYADEIRIGMTFADVTVPEPTSAALLCGLAAIGLSVRRR